MLDNENIIKMNDGISLNFGPRARLVSRTTIEEAGFTVNFYMRSGKILTYTHIASHGTPKFLLQLAAFGATSKCKSAVNKYTTEAEIVLELEAKIKELDEEVFLIRSASGSKKLNLTQRAYCNVNDLDSNASDVRLEVANTFAYMSKEDKAAMVKTPEMSLAIAKLKVADLESSYAV